MIFTFSKFKKNITKFIRDLKTACINRDYLLIVLYIITLVFLSVPTRFLFSWLFIRDSDNNSTNINIENVSALGDINGLIGNTSNESIRRLFNKGPLNIEIKNTTATGNVTGINLQSDKRLKIANPVKINTRSGSFEFDGTSGYIEL